MVEIAQGEVMKRYRPWAIALLLASTFIAVATSPVLAHGELAEGEGHDNPTTAELMLTPIVVGIIHIIAMVVLLAAAYRARAMGSVPDPSRGPVPDEAGQVFTQFLKEDDVLDHAFRPNRRMFMVSKNLPHFFVLTALATFFSVYTYKWLGDNTVWVYTSVHATAIVVLFAHSAMAWRHTWYGLSPKAIYMSFGSFSPLVISMPLQELDSIEVLKSRFKGMLDVSSLKLIFKRGKEGAKVDMRMRAIDSPDKIKEVIWDEATRSKIISD